MLDFLQPYNQFSEHDEKTLLRLVNEANYGLFCEIGCWTGHSTSIIGKRVKEINSKLIVIDNFKGNDGTPLTEYANDNNIKNIFIDNMKKLFIYDNIVLLDRSSDDAVSLIDDNSIGFIFIDAGHAYKQVKKDLINYLPKMIKNSIICGHDYESDTFDERYIDEDYVDGKHHGVIKAVNEIFGKVEHEGRMWWVK